LYFLYLLDLVYFLHFVYFFEWILYQVYKIFFYHLVYCFYLKGYGWDEEVCFGYVDWEHFCYGFVWLDWFLDVGFIFFL